MQITWNRYLDTLRNPFHGDSLGVITNPNADTSEHTRLQRAGDHILLAGDHYITAVSRVPAPLIAGVGAAKMAWESSSSTFALPNAIGAAGVGCLGGATLCVVGAVKDTLWGTGFVFMSAGNVVAAGVTSALEAFSGKPIEESQDVSEKPAEPEKTTPAN